MALQHPLENEKTCLIKISDTNQLLAHHVATCLLQQAELLSEYFSIAITQHENGKILLTGLPVLLDGYVPSAHGLPFFLLRLATEVDWTEEKPCFHGVCREVGAYYAMLADSFGDSGDGAVNDKDSLLHQVRHSLFPAISTLLIPPKKVEDDESCIRVLTTLSKLYRGFERC